MLSAYRRSGLVIALAIIANIASIAARPSAHVVAVPAVSRLIDGTGWYVRSTQQSGWNKMPWKQWQLYDSRGERAALYVEATGEVKRVVHWTGELGYLGEGYIVMSREVTETPLTDGRHAPVTVAVVQHGADRQLLLYAVVSNNGIEAHGTDNFIRTAWDTLRGDDTVYYLVRVSVPERPSREAVARATAGRIIAPVFKALSVDVGGDR